MIDGTANLLGALGLAVADRIHQAARDVLNRSGETPAAVIVIGYGQGLSNDNLRRILDLSHPGSVRLVDRLVADGLVERRKGKDRRAVALVLTAKGEAMRERMLEGRLASLRPLLAPLTSPQLASLDELLKELLRSVPESDLERCRICRMCDDQVCSECPIPAAFKTSDDAK
ncbi:MarR family winged helix-turn-helix transcriptional regulator [Erythrobacter rubeus]|uniref:MarR family transcriptional regulator n=1 Tax=Erythrobacter rubeus TaxID=2760803 RepID=A0ABR8KSM7_9SPHN|nr:MarR family transcriptional regulator [Erythrobacter rubeus]MBD2842595.1 MarR family transcriptional regulator [Erythrobacter rubeus]